MHDHSQPHDHHHHDHHGRSVRPPTAAAPVHAAHAAHSGHAERHVGHDKHAGQSVAMFRDRFWLTVALTVPTVIWSEMIQHWFGYTAPRFAGSAYIPLTSLTWNTLRFLRFRSTNVCGERTSPRLLEELIDGGLARMPS
jgi:hypothetical protein